MNLGRLSAAFVFPVFSRSFTTSFSSSYHNMANPFQVEVDRLHRFFVDWFSAKLDKDEKILEKECASYFSENFTMVPPSGALLEKQMLVQGLLQAHGSISKFEIDIADFKVLHEVGRSAALVAYKEIQRVGESQEQTERQSTALMEKTETGKIIWKHVQETWIKPPKSETK